MESSYFFKKLSGNGKLIIGIIIILLSALFQYLIIYSYNNEKNNFKQYEEANGYGEYVYVDVTSFTDYFATYKNDDTTKYYYFLSDGKYLYIGNLKPNDYNKLPGRIYGYTSTISSDLAKIAIDSYNEYAGEDKVNNENFYSLFGYYYIDATKKPSDDLVGFSIFNGIFFLTGVIILIVYITNNSKNKKELIKYNKEELINDINNAKTISNHRGKLYLTEKYVLSFKSRIDIIYYKDIVWIYPHTEKYRGTTSASIMIMDKMCKMHSVCYMPLTQKTNSEFNEIYANLERKVPDSLSGYTAENKEKAYDLINKSKEK